MSERDSRGRFTKPMDRAFRVGDRVKATKGCGKYYKDGDTGTMETVDSDGLGGWVKFDVSRHMDGIWAAGPAQGLTLLSAATYPKSEELLTAKDAEIVTLKAERDSARSEMMENYRNYREAQDRADAAEAKLADIAAITRVMEIAKASEDPDWDFITLQVQVIKGKAS